MFKLPTPRDTDFLPPGFKDWWDNYAKENAEQASSDEKYVALQGWYARMNFSQEIQCEFARSRGWLHAEG